jgi:hypothetical protein
MHRADTAGHRRKKPDMTTTASSRITAGIAAALVAAGILAGAAPVAAPARGAGAATAAHLDTHNLADYGAAITADNATDTARSAGVPHMSDNHKGSGSYFEQMNGGAN